MKFCSKKKKERELGERRHSNGKLGESGVQTDEERRLKRSAMEMSGCCDNGLSAAVSSDSLKRA